MKRISLLPNLITLAAFGCGMLAISKGIDALSAEAVDRLVFYRKLETAAQLVFLAMVFDALDGWVARLTGSASELGAQLDSLSDALTFGVAPALLAKILVDHEGPLVGLTIHPRLTFFAAGLYSVLAVLRLARFNLESDLEASSHEEFRGLPTPAAAGSVLSVMLVYLALREPRIEESEGTATLMGQILSVVGLADSAVLAVFVPLVTLLLPAIGFLMISRVPYVHATALIRDKVSPLVLVAAVVGGFALYLFPIPGAAILFNGYLLYGLVRAWRGARGERRTAAGEPSRP